MAIPLIAAAGRLITSQASKKFATRFGRSAVRGLTSGGSPSDKGMGDVKLVLDMDSYRLTLRSTKRDIRKVKQAGRQAMRAAAEVLHQAVRENMSSTKHSKSDLQRMDHPYAKRHGAGSTRIGGMKPYEIHDQDGRMLDALRVVSRGNQHGSTYEVKFDEAVAPYAKYVIDGTRVLRGRDVINETLNEPGTVKKMKKAMVDTIRERGPKGRFGKLDVRWSFK